VAMSARLMSITVVPISSTCSLVSDGLVQRQLLEKLIIMKKMEMSHAGSCQMSAKLFKYMKINLFVMVCLLNISSVLGCS